MGSHGSWLEALGCTSEVDNFGPFVVVFTTHLLHGSFFTLYPKCALDLLHLMIMREKATEISNFRV